MINVWKGCLKFFLDCVYCLIMNLYLHYFHYSIQFSIQLFNMKEMSPTGNNTVLDSSHCDIDLSIIFIFILQFWEWWLLQMKWYTYDLFLKIFFLREVPGIWEILSTLTLIIDRLLANLFSLFVLIFLTQLNVCNLMKSMQLRSQDHVIAHCLEIRMI